MNAYKDSLDQRFGDGRPAGEGVEPAPLLQQVLTRRTVRRYAGRQPEPALLDMLTATALSASSKSDFQQASILRVMDPATRPAN